MHASPFDFVSALSAEEQCPVCKELHAAVDECLCSSCQTHVCSDCSSLQPDTSWICRPCAAMLPARAYPETARPVALQMRHALISLREQTASAASGLQQLGPMYRRLATRALALRVALVALLLAAYAQARVSATKGAAYTRAQTDRAIAWSGPRLRDLTVRSRTMSMRAADTAVRQARLQTARVQRATVASVQFVRTLPVREHATSLLIATMILLAVARADSGPETR